MSFQKTGRFTEKVSHVGIIWKIVRVNPLCVLQVKRDMDLKIAQLKVAQERGSSLVSSANAVMTPRILLQYQ